MIFETLFLIGSAVGALSQANVAPQPQLVNITYYGSGCPADGGLTTKIGPLDTKTSISPLIFTLSNFTPTLGSFESGLRMCDIIAYISVDSGWKIAVNARGTQAEGQASLDSSTLLGLRGTYQFSDIAEVQSIGMLDIGGPNSGLIAKRLTPADGDRGVASLCKGGELNIEFQSRAVRDVDQYTGIPVRVDADETTWTLSTDIEVSQC